MIQITPYITLDEEELQFEFSRASGPGGQHINKVETAVQLRFNVKNSPSLPDYVRKQLLQMHDKRITTEGVLIISARRFRSQNQNRQDAVDRLIAIIKKAAAKPKLRYKTLPTPVSKRRRLEYKRRRGAKKKLRRSVTGSEDLF
jgi:ribosome-associated protein